MLVADMVLTQKTEGRETYSFDSEGREKFVQIMIQAGYVEYEAFRGKESMNGYWCRSCPAMADDDKSPTGYTCRKWRFADNPWGCCSSWYAFPNVQRIQESLDNFY